MCRYSHKTNAPPNHTFAANCSVVACETDITFLFQAHWICSRKYRSVGTHQNKEELLLLKKYCQGVRRREDKEGTEKKGLIGELVPNKIKNEHRDCRKAGGALAT